MSKPERYQYEVYFLYSVTFQTHVQSPFTKKNAVSFRLVTELCSGNISRLKIIKKQREGGAVNHTRSPTAQGTVPFHFLQSI